jgi:hypothetical protein
MKLRIDSYDTAMGEIDENDIEIAEETEACIKAGIEQSLNEDFGEDAFKVVALHKAANQYGFVAVGSLGWHGDTLAAGVAWIEK